MYKYLIEDSKKGYKVYVNLINSPAGQYLNRSPYLIGLVKEVLAPMQLTDTDVVIEKDMGHNIGNNSVVKTSDKDTIFYAQPPKQTVFSRYVKNRTLSPSPILTIVLARDKDGDYEIHDTWVGPFNPPFPGDAKETPTSKEYWESHAIVIDSQLIQSKTITKICPY